MRVEFTKDFEKSVSKLSGKMKDSLVMVIQEVAAAKTIDEIKNCKPIVNAPSIYRIRIGDKRAFFHYGIIVEEGMVTFIRLLSRGQAYNKENEKYLKRYSKSAHRSS